MSTRSNHRNDPAFVLDVADLVPGLDPRDADDERDHHAAALAALPERYRSAAPSHDLVNHWVRAVLGQAAKNVKQARNSDGTWSPMLPKLGQGPSVLLAGTVGVGKTWQAYGALRALSLSGVWCRPWAYGTAPDLYADMRPASGNNVEAEFQRLATARVLVLDDLGAGRYTEWAEDVTYRLVNHRYENRMPTMFTTNLENLTDMADVLGERVASRVMGMVRSAVLTGEDRRASEHDDLWDAA